MLMIKDIVKTMVGQCNEDIKPIATKIEEINSITRYTREYKLEKTNEYFNQIRDIKAKYLEKIEKEFDKKIDSFPKVEITGADNVETSNILKMLELSQNNLTITELQALFEKYEDNMIISKVLESIAERRNIRMESKSKKIINSNAAEQEKTKQLKDVICNGLKLDLNKQTTNLESLTVKMILEGGEQF